MLSLACVVTFSVALLLKTTLLQLKLPPAYDPAWYSDCRSVPASADACVSVADTLSVEVSLPLPPLLSLTVSKPDGPDSPDVVVSAPLSDWLPPSLSPLLPVWVSCEAKVADSPAL